MRWLLLLAAAAIVAVAGAIVWLVMHPVPRPTVTAEAAPKGTPPLEKPTVRPTRPASAAPLDPAEAETPQAQGTVVIRAGRTRRFRLYLDGELTDASSGKVSVVAGRHTFSARLLPEGTQTDDVTLEVGPGGTAEYEVP